MKSKEAIRNRIINYAGIVWNTKRIERIHPLIHLLIEELTDELYLLDMKLHNIDSMILEKLVRQLVPARFDYVHAAGTVIQVRSESNHFFLSRRSDFFIKKMPDDLRSRHIETVAFSPVTDTVLHNLGISCIFYNRKLWKVDDLGNRTLWTETNRRYTGNNLWLFVDNPEGMAYVKDLYFYIDFPHLNDNHNYYQNLSLIKWKAGGTSLQMEEGLPTLPGVVPSRVESDALSYYRIHYQRVKTKLYLTDQSQQVSDELSIMMPDDFSETLPRGCWITLEFPTHFRVEDIEKMHILLNAFPVLNRRYVEKHHDTSKIAGTIALPSEPGEELLELVRVEDDTQDGYVSDDSGQKSKQGVYSLDFLKKKEAYTTLLHDNLELFSDVLDRERSVFSGVDKDKVAEIRNAVAALQDKDGERVDRNILSDHDEIARLNVNLKEDTHTLNVVYWTTFAGILNNLPVGTELMAGQTTGLNKSEAVLITPASGGRVFFDSDSLKAINCFYITSKGRILSKHDILTFCRIEIGKYAKEIDAVRCGKISPRPGAGIVNAMEIRITPEEQHREYFQRKEVLRWLKLRLEERSPIHYNYFITVIE